MEFVVSRDPSTEPYRSQGLVRECLADPQFESRRDLLALLLGETMEKLCCANATSP